MNTPNQELVKLYDVSTGAITTIPSSELAPGMVRIRLDDSDEVLWADVDDLSAHVEQSKIIRPRLTGDRRKKVRFIQKPLRKVCFKTYGEWEDGFRRDMHVDEEIALWVRVARCLNEFTTQHRATPKKRKEAFAFLVACMNGTPTTVFKMVDLDFLSRENAQQLAAAFYSPNNNS